MAKAKIAVTLDAPVLDRLDRVVHDGLFPNRSQAIEVAVMEKLDRMEHRRLAVECAKLNPSEEQAHADEGLGDDLDAWPAY